MSRLRLVFVVGVAAALALPVTAGAAVRLTGLDTAAFPMVRATVVTSRPASAAPILRENGVPVVGLEAQNLGREKSVGLVLDRSQSMRGRPLADAARAARGFLSKKRSGDRVAVFAFGNRAAALTRSGTATIDATTVLRNLEVDSKQGTALYDGIVVAARQLAAEPLQGRVLIVLTDGKDTSSRASLADAVDAARTAGVAVYAIGIEGADFSPLSLQQLATRTGGRYYGASSTAVLDKVYGSIASELGRTWRLQYPTAARPGDRIDLETAVVGQGTARISLKIPDGNGSVVPPQASHFVPQRAYGSAGAVAVGLLVGALVLLAAGLAFGARRGGWVRTRLAAHTGEKTRARQKGRQQRFAFLRGLFQATEGAFGNLRQWRAVQRVLERGETPLRTVEFLYIVVGCAFLPALVAAVAGSPAPVILLVMAVGGSVPVLVAWLRMRKRLKAFEDQLPDLLVTIAASLKAGHSFKQGLQAVVDEGRPPASTEFRRVLTETGLGRPMDDALADMAERTGSDNFEFAITAVTIQRQVGGSLAGLFDMVADTVRQRQQFRRKIRSLTAMGRMSAYTLVGLPFVLAAAISVINPGYLSPLFQTKTGHWLLITGLVMMAIGAGILKKIVSFRG